MKKDWAMEGEHGEGGRARRTKRDEGEIERKDPLVADRKHFS